MLDFYVFFGLYVLFTGF